MKCDLCQGEYREKCVSRSYKRRGRTVVVDDVPVLVCDRCGDILLHEATVQAIHDLLQRETEDTAPLYRFPHKAGVTR